MYYASFGMLSLMLHLIINHGILKKDDKAESHGGSSCYRHFLIILTLYYLSDIFWGFLDHGRIVPIIYMDTLAYFVTMSYSVLLWTRFVVEYIGREGARSKSLLYAGYGIFGFILLHLVVNFFNPVIFSYNADQGYIPGNGRYFIFAVLFLLHAVLSIYSLITSSRSTGKDRIHYRTVAVSGFTMGSFILLQTLFPLLPFYSIGCILSTSLIHVFVEEDEKQDMLLKLSRVERKAKLERKKTERTRKEKEIYNHIAEGLAEDYEAIYYINIETGRYQEFSPSEKYQSMNVPKNGRDFYQETRENVRRFVHPDDYAFAVSLYYKDTMLKNLKGRKSYSCQYRIMVNGNPRYFRFVLMLAKDGKHFVLCDKDIQDDVTAEMTLREDRKKHATFGQIAESLASNYDVIYYVDVRDSSYVGYTSHNIYGQLEIEHTGEDFFEDSRRNIPLIIHPQNQALLLEIMDRDRLLSELQDRRQFGIEYRLIVDGRSQHTRLTARKSSDSQHLIIGVENIDAEVRKEREHQKALNTEKELARRDELTGVKNKTAYMELEQSVQSNIDNGIDYLPFAIAVCDINDLKQVNDSKGHKAGDEYIRSAAGILRDIFSHSFIFRIGGDEFAIFLRGDDYTARQALFQALRQRSEENTGLGDLPVIASGMSEYVPGADTRVSEVFERADNMMYENKRSLKKMSAL